MTKTITIPIPAIKLLTGLTLIFAAAKVFGFSHMSWFWVLFPVLLPVYIVVGVVLVGAAIICCSHCLPVTRPKICIAG
ncbi:hypothetical protein IANJMKHF_00439 [Klebsiella phage CPRSA]|nr:hypothetical protein IANJMKHF_00439 [Klebsiella phage CPRSA]